MKKEIFQENNVKWIHINKPSKADLQFVKSAFAFHPLVIESVTTPTLHPAVEDYSDHLFLILHFPVIYREKIANIAAEVDFLVTKDVILTLTYQTYDRLEELFDKLSSDPELKARFSDHHTGPLLYGIIDWLTGSLIHDLDFIETEITRIEDQIFMKQGPEMVEEISHTRRDILDFRRILAPMQSVLRLLPAISEKFYDKEMSHYFTDLLTVESKLRHMIENHKETIEALHATHESLLSNRISGIITLLTIFSVVIMPLNLIASIWGMNHQYLPLRDGPNDFWIVIASMSALFFALLGFFRYKRWL